MDLYLHTAMMFVPATTGLLLLVFLLYLVFYKKLPKVIPTKVHIVTTQTYKPLKHQTSEPLSKENTSFMLKVLFFVLLVRISLFVASYFGIPVSLTAVVGSGCLTWMALVAFKNIANRYAKKNPLVYPYLCF